MLKETKIYNDGAYFFDVEVVIVAENGTFEEANNVIVAMNEQTFRDGLGDILDESNMELYFKNFEAQTQGYQSIIEDPENYVKENVFISVPILSLK